MSYTYSGRCRVCDQPARDLVGDDVCTSCARFTQLDRPAPPATLDSKIAAWEEAAHDRLDRELRSRYEDEQLRAYFHLRTITASLGQRFRRLRESLTGGHEWQ